MTVDLNGLSDFGLHHRHYQGEMKSECVHSGTLMVFSHIIVMMPR